MAPRRPSMSDRIDGAAPTATVTPITRGRDAFTAFTEDQAVTPTGTPIEIPIALIDPSPDNPRSSLGDLTDLADSIKQLGVLQPLLVRPNGDRYDLIYGHRRLAAAKLAKRKTVPAFFNLDADALRDHSRRLVENLHREDLSPLDEARAFEQLLALGAPGGQRGVAKMVGKSQAYVSKRVGLLKLPDDVQAEVDSGVIKLNDGVELAKLADDPARLKEALRGAQNTWGGLEASVRRQVQYQDDERSRHADAERLRAAGVKVIDDAVQFSRQHGPYPLRNLPVEDEAHATLDCHAAFVPGQGPSAVLVCLDPQAHLHHQDDAAEEEQARQAAERAERDAARLAAAEARRDFTITLIRKGTPEAGAAVLMAQVIGNRHYYLRLDDAAVAQLLGISPDTFNGNGPAEAIAAFVAKGTRNAQRAVYATGLALGESSITQGYDSSGSARRAYLDHLVGAGYELAPYEVELLGGDDEDDYDYEGDDEDESAAEVDEAGGETGGEG